MPRPYSDKTIDELFDELADDAKLAKGLLDFARGLYGKNDEKIESAAVMAFIYSLRERIENVVDAIDPMVFELKARELEWKTAHPNVRPLVTTKN